MSIVKAVLSPLSFCVLFVFAIFLTLAALALKAPPARAAAAEPSTVFTNPAPISPADRASNNAGTNPGVPAANYPSPINVAGLTGTITKVTVTFAITSTFPDDLDILLVGPTGARSLVMSDAGGSGDHTNVTYTFDQTAATTMPNDPTAVVPAGTFQPSNFLGLATPEPGGQDNFPTVSGLASYPTDFNIFNGTNPNGTWNLYVVDDQVIDNNSLPSGWSIDITTGGAPADAHCDFNGDGRTDYVVVRNVGGGASGQIRWFISQAGSGTVTAWDWGIATDFFLMEDFDGDNKDDVAVWRSGNTPNSSLFYILQSNGFTLRTDVFGQLGDTPKVVGDYDGDGKADTAVYREGAAAGDKSFWFFRGSLTPGNITYVQWGQNGDFPSPGDYDGDAKWDFVVQRNNGGGQARFWRLFANLTTDSFVFGIPTDNIVPADYDGDGKFDIAVFRSSAGQLVWYIDRSSIPGVDVQQIVFGLSATDFATPGDYDGDGKAEPAVWRPNVAAGQSAFWTYNYATNSGSAFVWGQNGDYPVANFRRF